MTTYHIVVSQLNIYYCMNSVHCIVDWFIKVFDLEVQ